MFTTPLDRIRSAHTIMILTEAAADLVAVEGPEAARRVASDTSERGDVRAAVLVACSIFEPAVAIEVARDCLGDSDVTVRYAALDVLLTLLPSAEAQVIASRHRADHSESVRALAFAAIDMENHPTARVCA